MADSNQPNQTIMDDFLSMSWGQRFKFIRQLSLFPAITVMVFTRRRLGYRMMNPTWLLIMMIIMLVAVAVFPDWAGPFKPIMVIYALAMWGMGLWHRRQRWTELGSGVRWHTYSPGISWLEYIPWPAFFQGHSRVRRFIEPPVVAIIGLIVVFLLSRGLGMWIIWSALFLSVFEQDLFEKQLAMSLDTLDGLVNSEVQEENVKHFQQAQPNQKPRSIEDTAGIPTGIAPDIEKQVALRKAKRQPPPDNLAPVVT
jgi:hypothetical protein